MRFSVVHSTRYRYGAPVHLEPHTFRLCPRQDGAQRVARHELAITPAPAGRTDSLDHNGNVITQAWFNDPVESLEARSDFEVETLRENPFDFLLAPADRMLPEHSQPPGPIGDLSRVLVADSARQRMPFLTALTQTIFSDIRQIVRREGNAHPPEQTLAAREGSCRDLAVLFCAVCRAVGLDARFVSGYEREASIQDNGEMHAWAEVYFEGGGWRGFDPSRGLAVAASHVAVAAAADPALAAPVTGTFRGAARSSMEFQITMQVR
jgi:transglutaminase-like putative cysteine protease